jgi:hypothetical protein
MIVLGVAVVLLAFLGVLTGSWWGVVGAMTVLLAMVFVVVRNVLSVLGDVEAPSPTERARQEAAGVRDPDRRLNEQQQTDRRGGRVRRLFTEDSGAASSTEEQQSAWTPAPSRRVE